MKKLFIIFISLCSCGMDDNHNVKSINMIGDSRFISMDASVLRKNISELNGDLDFVGSIMDSHGFLHDSVGGEGIEQLLVRFENIPTADAHIIMFGTNDSWRTNIDIPFVGLVYIINELLDRGGVVFYVLQTPRTDEREAYNIKLDKKISNYFNNNSKFYLIDARSSFLENDDWENNLMSDHVHLSIKGVKLLADLINKKLLKYNGIVD
ncbi:MAG: Uncharacterised protein [Flavobacteriales bacterium]|nr:MAG: Uncharacterised protein [Flavobacteriales bacterium]